MRRSRDCAPREAKVAKVGRVARLAIIPSCAPCDYGYSYRRMDRWPQLGHEMVFVPW